VAWECRRCGRYHTSDDSVIVEVVGKDGEAVAPGQEGEVILTVLHSYAMPFLRLRLGDVARRPREPRRCAVSFGTLEHVEGRRMDYLRFPGGTTLAPFRLLLVIDEIEGVRRWELVQPTEARCELRFEARPGFDERALAAELRRLCGPFFPPDVTFEIETTPFADDVVGGAKLRFVRSRVRSSESWSGEADRRRGGGRRVPPTVP
jgi:phenylacetate-CoA ligase